jgi:excisionase family DNA binding protein
VTKSTGEEWIGAPTLAKELGVTLRTVYRILDTGELPAYKLGRSSGSSGPTARRT